MVIDSTQSGRRFQYDVLVIGTGIAGLSYVLTLAEQYPNARIALFSKKDLSDSNSYFAQGGIASVGLPQDSIEQHLSDTMSAADGLCDEAISRTILRDAPAVLQQLISWGVNFDKLDAANYNLTQEGGHSQRRIYHAGDRTGRAIMSALAAQVQCLKNVDIYENHVAINLITQTNPHSPGSKKEVAGAYILDESNDVINVFLANATILATGGVGKVYRYTSNPEIATGDGVAMAYRAGARVGNMEFQQFHPTVLYHQKENNFLISEALRGEGGYLISPKTGARFMDRYDPVNMELATRDVTARAIFNEIESNDLKYVYLDVRHLGVNFLQSHFPGIYQHLSALGIQMEKDMIPVVPAAHYCCGGVLTDESGQTDLKRLYVIGEAAFTGMHGANRLGSNSLLEGAVMGHNAANHCQTWLQTPLQLNDELQDWNSQCANDSRRAGQINSHWRSLRGEMTAYAGIVRTHEGLKDLLALTLTRKEMIEEYYWSHAITRDLIELRNIIVIAELITRSALNRHESRGGHYREDFPEKLSHGKETILQNSESNLISNNPFERPDD